MEAINVTAELRAGTGKTSNKTTRKEGRIPSVLYGQDGNTNLSVTHNGVKKLIYTPEFKLANLELDGKTIKCFIKDVQFHPVTDAIVHIDFLQLVDGQLVKVNVPIKFKGESEAVRAGGKLVASMRKVPIKAYPKDLVDVVYCDITGLELGQSIRVKSLEIPENIQVLSDPSTPVFRVEIPRALKSAAAEEAKEDDGTPEVAAAVVAE